VHRFQNAQVKALKEGAAAVQIAHASAHQPLKTLLIRLEHLHDASMLTRRKCTLGLNAKEMGPRTSGVDFEICDVRAPLYCIPTFSRYRCLSSSRS
jgi:hypothetical protein